MLTELKQIFILCKENTIHISVNFKLNIAIHFLNILHYFKVTIDQVFSIKKRTSLLYLAWAPIRQTIGVFSRAGTHGRSPKITIPVNVNDEQ